MVAQLGERTPYVATQQLLIEHIGTAGRKNVRLFPFTVPADFGGEDGDYFDGVHLGRVNGDHLLDALLKS